MRRSTIAVLVLALAGMIATSAAAEPAGGETYSIRVPVSDADFANEAAVHALYTRVEEAANAVCRVTLREAPFYLRDVNACTARMLEQTITDAGLAPLSRHYAAIRNGEMPGATTEVAAR